MQETDRHHTEEFTDDEDQGPSPLAGLTRGRVAVILGVLAALVLMALVPPLINVGRYRRQIAASIGLSLGRPVRIDNVTLNLLPMPGFTLSTFVVGEDPAFGTEPVIRANTVRADLRISSLWRRRVEFSRISLDDPSVNLVHRADGAWNVEGILLQAARMPAAPTAQKGVGAAPRFPYIEATGARVNVKEGLEKLPLSLTDADFALWLPEPKLWKLRLKGHPTRTDASGNDSGLLRVEGTLGQAENLADVPVEMSGDWTAAPLGAVSRLLTGRDAGLRGDLTLTAAIHGTLGKNDAATKLELRQVRRADFVPAHPLDADLSCSATLTGLFSTASALDCALPAVGNAGMTVHGTIPVLTRWTSAQLDATVHGVPVQSGLDLLRVLSNRIGPAVTVAGTVSAQLHCCETKTGEMDWDGARISDAVASEPLLDGDVSGAWDGKIVTLGPALVDLGGKEPAMVTLTLDPAGYTTRITGSVTSAGLQRVAAALPPFVLGLTVPEEDAPARIDELCRRTWTGEQSCQTAAPVARGTKRRGPQH